MRVIADFKVPETAGWEVWAYFALVETLEEFGFVTPADMAASQRVMQAITADMQPEDLTEYLHSLRHIAERLGGPVSSINILSGGYLRVRIRSGDFGELHATGQAIISKV